jgi:hypothetical protein
MRLLYYGARSCKGGRSPPMLARVLRTVLGCACLLLGCGREVFEHGPVARGDAAVTIDGAALDACADAADGTPCDDHDVCTPAASCRQGQCVPGNAFDSCEVADSTRDYGAVQGENDWYYGYWDAEADPDGSYDSQRDFQEMEHCDDDVWRPPGRCGMSRDDAGYRWTSNLGDSLQHPETEPGLELPVRRWRSDASGPARIRADHNVGGSAGDGTRALLLVDGAEIWRNDAEAGDQVGTQATLEVELHVGTLIEQIVHPIGSSADDTTYFAIVVEGR